MAPPPGTRGAPGLTAGDLLAARYRLVEPCSATTPGTSPRLWLAQDEVLARPVAAKVLVATGPDAAALTGPFLDAAAAAGAVDSPVLARVYDAAVEQRTDDGRTVDVAYVIREWVDGTPLPEVLARDGAYAPGAAVVMATALLEGLAVPHAAGLAHGRVHPGNVLVDRTGALRLTDLAVAAALPDGRVAAERAHDPGPVEADVRDAAAVLYALLTARWPDAATPQPSGGVRGAPALRDRPRARGRLISPRQVRAGVPTALDAAVVRALDAAGRAEAPELRTADALLDVLDGVVRTERPTRTASRRRSSRRRTSGLRRHVGVLGVVALLTTVGIASYAAGRSVGTLEAPPGQAAAQSTPAASAPAGPAAVPVDLTGVSVRDFDPDGDGQERPGSVANASDGDPSTAWETERYDSADFGGLKQGVGLLVDLGAPTGLRRVELGLTRPGVTAELRAAAQLAPDASSYRVLARARADGDRLALVPPAGTTERYLLVWLTGLAPDEERFSAGVTDLVVTG